MEEQMKSAKFRHLDKIIANDMEKIREDLSGQELATGAYCQDYDTFKIIYQFIPKGIIAYFSKHSNIATKFTNSY